MDITADYTKFNYVISTIDSNILNSVSYINILFKVSKSNEYDTLKKRLI